MPSVFKDSFYRFFYDKLIQHFKVFTIKAFCCWYLILMCKWNFLLYNWEKYMLGPFSNHHIPKLRVGECIPMVVATLYIGRALQFLLSHCFLDKLSFTLLFPGWFAVHLIFFIKLHTSLSTWSFTEWKVVVFFHVFLISLIGSHSVWDPVVQHWNLSLRCHLPGHYFSNCLCCVDWCYSVMAWACLSWRCSFFLFFSWNNFQNCQNFFLMLSFFPASL